MFFKFWNAGLIGILSVWYRNEQICRCWNLSGTEIRGCSPVPYWDTGCWNADAGAALVPMPSYGPLTRHAFKPLWLVADMYCNTLGGRSLYRTDCGTVQTEFLGAVSYQLQGRAPFLSGDLQAGGNSISLCLTKVLWWPPRKPLWTACVWITKQNFGTGLSIFLYRNCFSMEGSYVITWAETL